MSSAERRADPSRRAQELYVELLAGPVDGLDARLGELCDAHPALSTQFRELHAEFVALRANLSLEPSEIAEHLCRRHAEGPTLASGEADEGTVRRILDRLEVEEDGGRRYELGDRVGRGGTSTVYRVHDRKLDRELAMKVVHGVHPGCGPESARRQDLVAARFLEEAQITSQLDHPGIVPVHDLGSDEEGRLYFTMRLVRGRDLHEVFRLADRGKEGWTTTRLVGVILKACEAVAYAHSKGVIHRDLKPSNLMVGRFGAVYVMDWGLAKVLGREEPPRDHGDPLLTSRLQPGATLRRQLAEADPDTPVETQEGEIFGTPPYMPPEQAWGAIDEMGPHSDVYSMGAVLYRLLAGRRPYEGEGSAGRLQLLYRVVQGPPEPVKACRPDAPDELVAVCEKAMSRETAARYPDMMEMAEDLRAYLDGRVVRAHRTGVLVELRKWLRRNRRIAATVLAALVIVAGVLLRSTFLVAAKDAAVTDARTEARTFSYVLNAMSIGPVLESGDHATASRLVRACPEDLRGWEWRFWSARADQALRSFDVEAVGPGGEIPVAFDPSGRRMAVAAGTDSVLVFDAVTGERVGTLNTTGGRATDLAFRDSDQLTVATEDGFVRSWSLSSGRVLESFEPVGDAPPAIAAAGDTGQLVIGRGTRVGMWNAGEERPVYERQVTRSRVNDVDISADGEQVVFVADSGSFGLIASGVGKANQDPTGAALHVALNPTAELAAVAISGGSVRIHALPGLKRERILFEENREARALAWDPSGQRLALGTESGSVLLGDLEREAEGVRLGHEAPVCGLAYSPDGDLLAASAEDGRVRLFSAHAREGWVPLTVQTEWVVGISFHPFSGRLALLYRANHLPGVFDLETGRVSTSLAVGSGYLERTGPPEERAPEALPLEERGQALSADWKELASGIGSAVVRRWRLPEGTELPALEGHEGPVRSVAYSPAGDLIATGADDGTVRLWAREGGGQRAVVAELGAAVTTLAFDADGGRLAAGDEAGAIRVVDLDPGSGGVHLDTRLPEAVTAVAFGRDGLLAAGSGASILVWDLEEGADEPVVMAGHSGAVSCLSFHPHEERLVSAALGDPDVHVWEVTIGACATILRGHDEPVSCVAFDASGELIVSASVDGLLRLWPTDPAAADRLWREAVQQERARAVLEPLFAEQVFAADVLKRLDDLDLPPELAATAALLAAARDGVPESVLFARADRLVRLAVAGEEDSTRALRIFEALHRRAPDEPVYLSRQGLALVRLRRYEEALTVLEEASLSFRRSSEPRPRDEVANLLFYSMALAAIADAAGDDMSTSALDMLREARRLRRRLREEEGSIPDWLRAFFTEAAIRAE